MANFFPIFALTLPPKVRSYPSGPPLSDHYMARTGTPSKVSARFVPGRAASQSFEWFRPGKGVPAKAPALAGWRKQTLGSMPNGDDRRKPLICLPHASLHTMLIPEFFSKGTS